LRLPFGKRLGLGRVMSDEGGLLELEEFFESRATTFSWSATFSGAALSAAAVYRLFLTARRLIGQRFQDRFGKEPVLVRSRSYPSAPRPFPRFTGGGEWIFR